MQVKVTVQTEDGATVERYEDRGPARIETARRDVVEVMATTAEAYEGRRLA